MKQNLKQVKLYSARSHQLPCAGAAECLICDWEFNLSLLGQPKVKIFLPF